MLSQGMEKKEIIKVLIHSKGNCKERERKEQRVRRDNDIEVAGFADTCKDIVSRSEGVS